MAFQLDTASISHQLVVGQGFPINTLGVGPQVVRGSSYIEGPAQMGNPASFPSIAATLMVGPLTNRDVRKKPGWSTYIQGNLRVNGLILGNIVAATVAKPFIIDHPTKQNKKLVHVALEGPENGVYFRGKLNNSMVIELPEYWTNFVNPESITVNLTPIVRFQELYVEKIENNKIYVKNRIQDDRINCYYHVYGERCDIDKLEVEVDSEKYDT